MTRNGILICLMVLVFSIGSVPVLAQGVHVFEVGNSGYLGVLIIDVENDQVSELGLERAQGVLVTEVVADGPASKAGIQAGDVVVEYAAIPVISARHLRRLIGDTPPGRVVDMNVLRNKGRIQVSVEIGEREGHPDWRGRRAGVPFSFSIGPEIEVLPKKQLKTRIPRARLGISGTRLTDQMAKHLGVDSGSGVLVMEVHPGTPAEATGLQAGDVITRVDGKTVESIQSLRSLLSEGIANLEIVRDGTITELAVDLGGDEKEIKKESDRL